MFGETEQRQLSLCSSCRDVVPSWLLLHHAVPVWYRMSRHQGIVQVFLANELQGTCQKKEHHIDTRMSTWCTPIVAFAHASLYCMTHASRAISASTTGLDTAGTEQVLQTDQGCKVWAWTPLHGLLQQLQTVP